MSLANLTVAACLALLFGLGGVACAADAENRPALDGQLSLRAFQAYLGEPFQVWGGEGARAVEHLRLIEVRDQGSSERIEQFTLRFRAELTSTLVKATYSFKHPESGYFDLWLEPAGQDEAGRYFEARFSLVPLGATAPPTRARP